MSFLIHLLINTSLLIHRLTNNTSVIHLVEKILLVSIQFLSYFIMIIVTQLHFFEKGGAVPITNKIEKYVKPKISQPISNCIL